MCAVGVQTTDSHTMHSEDLLGGLYRGREKRRRRERERQRRGKGRSGERQKLLLPERDGKRGPRLQAGREWAWLVS